MDNDFYNSVESLLCRPPPKLNFVAPSGNSSSSSATKNAEKEIKKNKAMLRKLEQQTLARPAVNEVKSKIDTGDRRRGSGGGKGKRRGVGSARDQNTNINEGLLAEAFKYAERCAAVEALDDMPGEAAKAAMARGRGGEGFFAGNPMGMVREVKQQRFAGGGGGGGGGGKGSYGQKHHLQNPSANAHANRAYLGATGVLGGPGMKKKKGAGQKGRQQQKGMSYGGTKDKVRVKAEEMERLLQQLTSGDEVGRLRAELEESKKVMERSSDFLKSAAGDFLSAHSRGQGMGG